MDTIALFGGSFDPPHIGHEAIVKALKEFKEIDKVIVMPTFLNPFKSKFYAPSSLRMKWLKEIFSEYENVEISDYEVSQEKQVPTIATVKHLLKSYKKIYLIIGADNLALLHTWNNYNELRELVTFIVAPRDNIEIPKEFLRLNVDEKISSTNLRENIEISKLPKECAKEIYNFYKEKPLQNRIEKITQVLDKNKAENIEVFDLRDKNYFVDYAIIASSLGQRHTSALLDHLKTELKPAENFNAVDESGDWIVIDLGDILIHIMTPEYRVKYDMETFLSSLANGKEGTPL